MSGRQWWMWGSVWVLAATVLAALGLAALLWFDRAQPSELEISLVWLLAVAAMLSVIGLTLSIALVAAAHALCRRVPSSSAAWSIFHFAVTKPENVLGAVLAVVVISLLGHVYDRIAVADERRQRYRDLLTDTAEGMALFRASITSFISECAPRALQRHATQQAGSPGTAEPTVLGVDACAEHYDGVVAGWSKASWGLPLFIDQAKPYYRRDRWWQQGGACDYGHSLKTASCQLLSQPDPTLATSTAFRRLRLAYARNLQSVPGSWPDLALATAALFHESHRLGCALIIAGYPYQTAAEELGSASCRVRFETADERASRDIDINVRGYFEPGATMPAP